MAKASIKIRDSKKEWDAFKKQASKLEGQPRIRVGVLSQESYGGGLTVQDVATFHEFGTIHAPQRSFIRSTYDANIPALTEMVGDAAAKVLAGSDMKKEGGLIGLWLQAKIQKRITDRIPPPLAQSTIDAKGSDVPLIDTGRLRRSITFEVIE